MTRAFFMFNKLQVQLKPEINQIFLSKKFCFQSCNLWTFDWQPSALLVLSLNHRYSINTRLTINLRNPGFLRLTENESKSRLDGEHNTNAALSLTRGDDL